MGVTHVMIIACRGLHFDLVSLLFGTSIPTSFNILVKMFLHLYIMEAKFEIYVAAFSMSMFMVESGWDTTKEKQEHCEFVAAYNENGNSLIWYNLSRLSCTYF